MFAGQREDAMKMPEAQWTLLSARPPWNEELPVIVGGWGEDNCWKYFFLCSISSLRELVGTHIYTHWRSVAMRPPPRVLTPAWHAGPDAPPPKVKTLVEMQSEAMQWELDEAELAQWVNREDADDAIRDAWHAALAHERAEIERGAP